ncbi:MAG: glycosyltransferase family 4 protein [Bacteroidaceae bacterium]
MNKNILHVVNIYFVIPYFLGEQLDYFNDKGYRVHIVCSPSEQLESYSRKHHFFYKEIDILRKIAILKDIKAIVGIYKYIRKNKVEIVTGHTPKGALLAMIASFIARVPNRIYFRHGLVYETATGLKRFLLINMDRLAAVLATKVICVSPSVAQLSIDDHLNSRDKQQLLGHGTCNGIDVEQFSCSMVSEIEREKLRKELNLVSTDFVIGFTGRLVHDKGIVELVESLDFIKNKNAILLLVGMFEERDSLPESLIYKIKNDDRIRYTGYINNADINKYYSLMNLFVLPSYREGFPTSVLEASSMELPIITTKATGCVDSIIENKTGVFVSHNLKELALAIDKFMEDEYLRIKYGKAGRQFVLDNFEQHVIWEEIEKLYIQ